MIGNLEILTKNPNSTEPPKDSSEMTRITAGDTPTTAIEVTNSPTPSDRDQENAPDEPEALILIAVVETGAAHIIEVPTAANSVAAVAQTGNLEPAGIAAVASVDTPPAEIHLAPADLEKDAASAPK